MPEPLTRSAATALVAAALGLCAAGVHAQDAALAKSIDAAALLRETEAAVRLAGGLKVQASKAALRDGEALVLSIELPRAGYLNVVSVNPEGVPTVLFPNQAQSDNRVEAGPFTLPTAQMQFELRASAPYGTSTVAAFLTQEPLSLYANGDGDRNAAGALLGQFARLSTIGRDLLNVFGTKSLVLEPKAAPMAAGMTTVLACAKTGPCDPAAPGAASRLVRILDALTPGILLEPEDKSPVDKSVALRPVYDKGIKLTKVSEGFVPRLYEDAAGYCSIAYGHLIKLAPCHRSDTGRFTRGIAEPDGGRLLVQDMARAQRAVLKWVKAPLTDGQFAALCDFTYNVGAGNLQRSTLLKAVNAQEHQRVPFQFRRWSKAGGKEYRGLKTRREREIALYFEGADIPKVVPKGEDETPLDIRTGEPGS